MEHLKNHHKNHVFHYIKKILFFSVIFVFLFFTVANIQVNRNNDIAHVLGSGFLSAQTDSMNSEQTDSFASGDILLVKMLDETLITQLEIGDIVTFYDQDVHQLITHRIIEIYQLDQTMYFITQGDDMESPDQPIRSSEILAVYQSSIGGLGVVLDYLQSPKGFFLFILIPVLILLIIEGFKLIKGFNQSSKTRIESKMHREYQQVIRALEHQTMKIRKHIMSNWLNENDKDIHLKY
ncbi:MAG: signal peptidase I [Firmicutes bacterium]|nr:signal peptidase I [Bacillota bacterium]